MSMSKENNHNTTASPRLLTIRGEVNKSDLGALVCDVVMLAIFLWNQIRYGMNMLFLIIPLFCVGVFIVVFGIVPEQYRFGETSLEIVHRFRKDTKIPYETVFNYDALAHDSYLNILQGNTVKVYHTVGGKKKLTVCRPQDVESFTEVLKINCPEFHSKEKGQVSLEVFFDN